MNRVIVRAGTYRDSITLLRISQSVEKVEGIIHAAVVMATPLNKRVLADLGFELSAIQGLKSDDLVIAIQGRDGGSVERAVAETDRLLASDVEAKTEGKLPGTLTEAVTQSPSANLAVISVPGRFAKREAMNSLRAGLNVFLFSSNVPRQDERELKEAAVKAGLLMMGPDCGTAIINRVVLGFGNSVRDGAIGIISASGTGLQEVATLVHRSGLGISQAIGTGGGDLSDEVGGLMTEKALDMLAADKKTKVIVVISKPPGAKTLKKMLATMSRIRKPVVVSLLGSEEPMSQGKLIYARTLKRAAEAACESAGGRLRVQSASDEPRVAFTEASQLKDSQRFIRGIYAGGTLCYEAQVVLSPLVGRVSSNAPIDRKNRVDGSAKSKGHSCIDMGAEEFVVGRAHPMIDYTIRKMRIVEESKDPEVAVILLDVELGIGSNPDPAGELLPAIAEAKANASRGGRYLSVVASVIGTDGDFQDYGKQTQRLVDAGVLISSSNAGAAELAALIATRGTPPKRVP